MFKKVLICVLALGMISLFSACGGKAPVPSEAKEEPAAAEPAAPEPQSVRLTKIGDFLELWNSLYKQNEAAINNYDGMPIIALVSPQMSFATSVQYDILNTENKDGRFEGKLMLAGFKGWVEKSGQMIRFGYEDSLTKDGFGPSVKAGDKLFQKGELDLATGYYWAENSGERAGKRISRSRVEFKLMKDGSIACLDFTANGFDIKGDVSQTLRVIYLHNGPGRYDFVVAKGETGPDFEALTFANAGDMTQAQALEAFKSVGYIVEKSGGIKDGKLFVNPF